MAAKASLVSQFDDIVASTNILVVGAEGSELHNLYVTSGGGVFVSDSHVRWRVAGFKAMRRLDHSSSNFVRSV